ncbi:MAG: zinc-ribbon domain-containing protein [Candidatus Bathyarchaeota archaeon]|nr:zinc-ribbon domain-containing protein [Candidatus Bathyarchaeota archaeon]
MPYCHKCGAKLQEDAHFCHRCGTPVMATPTAAPAPVKPLRKDPVMLGAIVLIAILLTAVIVIAVAAVPFSRFDFNQTNHDSHPNIRTLNLDFYADVGEVNVATQNINDYNILIHVSANGSRSLLRSSNIEVTFTNETVGDVLTITSKVTVEGGFLSNTDVDCVIYVNPALNLNLNVTSRLGQVSLTAQENATLQSVNLNSNAGTVQANLQENVTVAGDISLETNMGTVHYRMSETTVEGNCTVNLQSNMGSVNMDITQTTTLSGNLKVNADTSMGSVNVGLKIDGDVGAKITSETNLGNIDTDVRNFSGDKSPLQSNNYPAASNIEIDNHTNLGSININAAYQSSTVPIVRA